MHESAVLFKAGVAKKKKKRASNSSKTPQFHQQVVPNVEPAAFFRRTGVKKASRACDGRGEERALTWK